jgi:hypothetical protein
MTNVRRSDEVVWPSVAPWRPPTVPEVLKWGIEVTGVGEDTETEEEREAKVEAFCSDRKLLQVLNTALDDPTVYSRPASLETVALNAAEMVERLLAAPIPTAVRLAYLVVAATLRRSGVQWHCDELSGRLVIEDHARSSAGAQQLAARLLPKLEFSPRVAQYLDRPPDWDALLATRSQKCSPGDCPLLRLDSDAPSSLPGLYLAHPILGAKLPSEEPSVSIEAISHQVQLAVEAVLEAMPLPHPIRLLHPGNIRSSQGPSGRELEMLISDSLLEATALIVADLDLYDGQPLAPGFGSAIESLIFRVRSGPILIARFENCQHSALESFVANDSLRVTKGELHDAGDLTRLAMKWMAANFEEILACNRRRINAEFEDYLIHARLLKRVAHATNEALLVALRVSGISVAQLERIINHPGVSGRIPNAQLRRFEERLLPVARRVPTAPAPVLAPEVPGLDRIAFELGFPEGYTRLVGEVTVQTVGGSGVRRLVVEGKPECEILDQRLREGIPNLHMLSRQGELSEWEERQLIANALRDGESGVEAMDRMRGLSRGYWVRARERLRRRYAG